MFDWAGLHFGGNDGCFTYYYYLLL